MTSTSNSTGNGRFLRKTNATRYVRFALLCFLLSFCNKIYAQIPASAYGYTAVSGTFTEITGGTTLSSLLTDDASSVVPIGFTFSYCGQDYTQIRACSNGWLSFNLTAGTDQWTNSYANLTANNIKPALMPLWDDMGGTGGEARYVTTGTAPNRVFTFQYKNWQWYVGNNNTVSLQVRLYETTNLIEFQYRQETGTTGTTSATIGIADGAATPTYLTLNNATATATVSSTTFNTSISTKPVNGQIYRFTPPPACNTSTSLPTAGTTSVSPASLCLQGNVTMTVTPNAAVPAVVGLTYKWQSAPAATGPWTDIPGAVTNTPSYTTTTAITTAQYFRGVLLCLGTTTVFQASASAQVVVNNPGSPTPTAGTRCGPGTVSLSAVPPAGSTLNWYASATGGAPIGTGSPFTTPYIPTTTTFYVAAASGSSAATPQIGTATTTLPDYSSGGPFSNYYRSESAQYLYTSAELIAAGGGSGTINTIAFNCTEIPLQSSNSAITTLPNYKVFIKTVPSSTTTLTWQAAASFTQVYTTTAFNPVLGWNTFTLSTPFFYNGTDNIIVSICYDQTSPGYSSGGPNFNAQGKHQYTAQTGRVMYFNDDNVTSGCGQTGTATSTYLPNVRFGMTLGCVGPRIPVVATVTPAPTFTKSNPLIVCNGAVDSFVVTSPVGSYASYTWTPATDLYTNAAATTPYVAGASASKVYFKSTTVGAKTYGAFASNPTAPFCASADTVRLWVQPGSVTIKAVPDTICVTGTSTMSLVPNTGYAANSIQWQQSPDGNTYTDIAGATGVTYTSGTLSAPTPHMFYKAVIKSNTANPCMAPVQKIVIADPQLVSTKDSFNCGPGTVTLEAVSDGVSNIKWYTSMTASQPIGSGSPFTTPYLGATTSYFVAASTGTPQPAPTFVTTGISSGGYSDLPLFTGYYLGTKTQYIIPASAMNTAGFVAGFITQVGYDIVSAGSAVENMTISLKNTATTLLPTTFPSTFETGVQQVYTSASFQPLANQVNVLNLQTPFYWDGTSNILIEECHRNSNYGTASEVRYTYGTYGAGVYCNSDAVTICTAPPASNTYATGSMPKMWIGMRGPCESNRVEVTAYIHPKPAVDLGQNVNQCVDAGAVVVLDAGVQPNSPVFEWDNGTSQQIRGVSVSGDYNVKVTNSFGCVGSDTINVTLRQNPVVELGNDTTVCNGVVLNLNAGNDGIEYFWNTGAVSQTININTAGTYNVFVTNGEACVKADTIVINMQGELPNIQGINISNNGQYTFHFTAVNPQNIVGYDWDFGDGTPHSYAASPSHTYATAGNYIVVLRLSSTCGFLSDSTSAHIVGIHQINVDDKELSVYPNPTRDQATILVKGSLKMEKVEVYNVLGQLVYKATADAQDKHTLQLGNLASGVYTIQVFTDKGNVARKLEVLK